MELPERARRIAKRGPLGATTYAAQLEAALQEIRDKWVPALRRDAREADKTLCNAGGISHLIARTIPECELPKDPQ